MKAFITEDDIEQKLCELLTQPQYGWTRIECNPSVEAQNDLASTGRKRVEECILPEILFNSLKRLNPQIAPEILEDIVRDLRKDFTGTDMVQTNYKMYGYIRNGIQVKTKAKHSEDFDRVRLIDFNEPANNDFHCVNQMWIKGHYRYRRPDVLLFVNGLPIVFIELKNSTVKIEESYNKNLVSYRKDIPNIFAFNQICVLSNGLQTKIGAWNSNYEHFFEWLRVNDEKEKIDRDNIERNQLSIVTLVDGLFRKDRLIDYIENFVLFNNKKIKIIAKNHQYLGVNNLMKSVEDRKRKNGKLGVFWHTQGSGKSYSMVFFVRKVKRKMTGNFTFLIVTDRDDLDTQIHKTFVRTEVIGEKEETQPKTAKQLREFLQQKDKSLIFTLIQKFQYDKNKPYPILSERDDIFVLVDEAHRTQYKSLAENMHTGLPNANYIAFTGTPLLGTKCLTIQWFGNYVSEYNFSQAIDDGSTVPLYYSRRVPEVWLENKWLDTDVATIVEDENLNEREQEVIENSAARIIEVIKREDRLDKIAQDIAHHFPRRGYLGKGMVVSVDKYTAVKMYDKVQHYWAEEKKALIKERNEAKTEEERKRLTDILNFMNSVDMAVVISEEAEEAEKFSKEGLDITVHRQKMKEITPDGKDIEDRFKDENDSLQLVFVCAMWLTGFDVPSLSTLYLDKPMKDHTLMQGIARANRVFPGKAAGVIIDYVNVFGYMKKALKDYAGGSDGEEFPVKDIEVLINNIEETIEICEEFLRSELGEDLNKIIAETDSFERLEMLRLVYDKILSRDEWKDRFKVMSNLLINLYDASKPEVFERGWKNDKLPAITYINGLMCNQIDDVKIQKAKQRMQDTLDQSVSATNQENIRIHEGQLIDLSKLDIDEVRRNIGTSPYKSLEIDNVREFIERLLQQLINKNKTRITFSERYKNIIDRYNAGGSENQDYYEQLLELIEELKKEQARSTDMGLEEEELEIYDLLCKDRRLTKAEEQEVILASKNLYQKLMASKDQVMVVDWYKDEQPKAQVMSLIRKSLGNDLPRSYDRVAFTEKLELLFSHFVDMAVQGYGWVAA